jgi:ABC-type molybdate transport system substrate-binding protein
MRRVRAATLAVLALMLSPGIAAAADIRVLSVGSVQIATKVIAAEFEKTSGHKVLFTIVSPDRIAERLASASYDMLIAPCR